MSALNQYLRIQHEAEMQRAARIQRALERDADIDRVRLEQPHSEDAEYAALLYTLYGVACFIGLVMAVAIVWSGWGR